MLAPHHQLYLIRLSGEVTTKASRTRARFTSRLCRNLEAGLRAAGIEYELRREWSRLYVEAQETTPGAAGDVIRRTFGVQSYSPVERRTWRELDDLVAAGEEIFGREVAGRSFAVRARRGGDRKKIPLRSKDVEIRLGAALLPHARKVDLDAPEVTASVEVHPREAYFFRDKTLGPSGLPLGTEDRALSLISGGFDSAVASWMMLRRGVGLDYVFFNLGGTAHELGVLRVLKVLAAQWSHGDRPTLHSVDFRPVVAELQGRVTPRYWQVVLKRLMLRAAQELARELRLGALVTGEAVGQVSSQTPRNLAVISRPIELEVFRPLVAFNKEEIIDRAREIGTYELSAAVDEYCAILPKKPATRASAGVVDDEEGELDRSVLARAVAGRRVLDLQDLDPAELGGRELEIDGVPEGARLVDLRPRSAYDAWHPPDAEHMDFFQALKTYRTFDRDATWVFYCEVGLKSAHLAELMQGEGFRAYHLPRGIRDLMERETGGDPLAAQLLSPAVLTE
ncbi:MAG: tRNA uracil 4-sulfurtransferase ThiI [Acidobacteriota bacterium]